MLIRQAIVVFMALKSGKKKRMAERKPHKVPFEVWPQITLQQTWGILHPRCKTCWWQHHDDGVYIFSRRQPVKKKKNGVVIIKILKSIIGDNVLKLLLKHSL